MQAKTDIEGEADRVTLPALIWALEAIVPMIRDAQIGAGEIFGCSIFRDIN